MSALEKLLGSQAKVKLIRLFYLNPEMVFPPREVVRRAQISPSQARRELALLLSLAFIKRGSAWAVSSSARLNRKATRKKVAGFALNPSFTLFEELRNLALTTAPVSRGELVEKIRRTGRIKLIVLAGIFLKTNSRIDILIVGDRIRRGTVERIIHAMEADIGKELEYALLDTAEFKYRLGMYDKFVRDILDYPHEVLVDKIGLDRQ